MSTDNIVTIHFMKNRTIRNVVWFMFMVLNATFNNISVMSWWSDSLLEETAVP